MAKVNLRKLPTVGGCWVVQQDWGGVTGYVIDYVYNQVTKLAEIYLDGVQIASGTKNWNEKLGRLHLVGDEAHASTVNAFQGTLHE